MLELDYTNSLDNAVGASHGIPKIAFQKASESCQHMVGAIEKAHESGTLGFAKLPFDDEATNSVMRFAREHPFPNILILGIGGSALGPMAIDSALSRPHSGKKLIALDNIDPDYICDQLDLLSPK